MQYAPVVSKLTSVGDNHCQTFRYHKLLYHAVTMATLNYITPNRLQYRLISDLHIRLSQFVGSLVMQFFTCLF